VPQRSVPLPMRLRDSGLWALLAVSLIVAGCDAVRPAATAFRVVDSSESPRVIGEFLHPTAVLVTTDEHTFTIGIQSTRLFGRVELYYELPDCVGSPFVRAGAGYENLLLMAAIDSAGMVHVADVEAEEVSFLEASKVDSRRQCVPAAGRQLQGKPAVAALDVSTLVPPFSIE